MDSHYRVGPGSFSKRTELYESALGALANDLKDLGGRLYVLNGNPEIEVLQFIVQNAFTDLWFADEIEPNGIKRDSNIERQAMHLGVTVHICQDQYLYAPTAFETGTGKAYSVFTPFKKRCLAQLPKRPTDTPTSIKWLELSVPTVNPKVPIAGDDFCAIQTQAGYDHYTRFCSDALPNYALNRDLPSINGTSRLSPHLHLGVVSPRRLIHQALNVHGDGASTFVSELLWREFYAQVLYHRPDTVTACFQRQWDQLNWENHPDYVAAWMEGRTGYPIVDAAMRQLNTTGWMHNRLRMIVASFLTKDLLVDWRIGEAYFRSHLLDGDLASNVGGWQWAASTGTDAQPWFRVFNPVSQGQKFDLSGSFVRQWIPELRNVPDKFIHAPWLMSYSEMTWLGLRLGHDYPEPIVDHGVQRLKALEMFKKVTLTREPS
jgi:deoxyribodipyrimidine photo-lyase